MNVIIISKNESLIQIYRSIGGEYPSEKVAVVYLNPEKMTVKQISYTLTTMRSPRIIVMDLILRDPYPHLSEQLDGYYDSSHTSDARAIFESLRQDERGSLFIFTFFSSCGNKIWRRWIGDESSDINQIAGFADYGGSQDEIFKKHKRAFCSLIQ